MVASNASQEPFHFLQILTLSSIVRSQCCSAVLMPSRSLDWTWCLLALQSGFLVLFQTNTCMAFSSLLHQLALAFSETGTESAGRQCLTVILLIFFRCFSFPPGVGCLPSPHPPSQDKSSPRARTQFSLLVLLGLLLQGRPLR